MKTDLLHQAKEFAKFRDSLCQKYASAPKIADLPQDYRLFECCMALDEHGNGNYLVTMVRHHAGEKELLIPTADRHDASAPRVD